MAKVNVVNNGSMSVNDLVTYLMRQTGLHTEQLNTLNDATRNLHKDTTELDHRLSGRLDSVLSKLDAIFKWKVGALIIPIITMVITIIIDLLLVKK